MPAISSRPLGRPLGRTLGRTAAASLALSASACIGLGGNVEGSFSCRAPQGDCAPSHVIDARATAELDRAAGSGFELASRRAGAASSDMARTPERTIRIVFPAHVDEAGALHDEAVAWAVVERPQWAGQLRGEHAPHTMRQLRRQLRQAQRKSAQDGSETADTASADGAAGAAAGASEVGEHSPAPDGADAPVSILPSDFQLFPLASPPFPPSPAVEARAGALAPAAEGSVVPPRSRDWTPRPSPSRIEYPSLEALEAARRKTVPGSDGSGKSSSDTVHEEAPASHEEQH